MTTAIARHTSTISLVSQNSVHVEAGLLVQCLNRYKDVLEAGCERILQQKCSGTVDKDTILDNTAPTSGTISPNSFVSRSSSGPTLSTNVPPLFRRLDTKAREVLGQHLVELLATIVLPDPPQSIKEVDLKLGDGLPTIPDKMLPTESDGELYRMLATKKRKGLLLLPVKEIHTAFKEFHERFNFSVSLYIVAVVEHIIGNFLKAAICYEETAFSENIIRASTVETLFTIYRNRIRTRRKTMEPRLANRFPQDYDKCVDELDDFLRAALEQLNLLLRVFREPVQKNCADDASHEDNARAIFGNMLDLYNNMRVLADTLNADEDEDTYSPGLKSKISQDLYHSSVPSTVDTHYSSSASTVSPNTAGSMEKADTSHSCSTGPRCRLVGVGLIELAEDDSLHAFSHYAACVLDSTGRERIWALMENGCVVQTLCRLSRTILHTASFSKSSTHSGTSVANLNLDSSADLHSFLCKHCLFWDSVSVPRRRSTSSTASRSLFESEMKMSSDFSCTYSKTLPKQHQRTSNSSSSLDDPVTFASCNYLVNSFKYLLPRLLLLPIFQFFYLHELIKNLHHCAYDMDDRARLKEVLSMLSRTRACLERDLTKHPWICLHLSRLISTGHLAGQYRSLYLDLLTGSYSPPSPTNYCASPRSASTSPNPNSPSATSVNSLSQKTSSFGFPPSVTDSVITTSSLIHKLDEIERLLGTKGKLGVCNRQFLGDFVMEGRVYLSTESKRSFSEHVIYLFTGLLLVCKWQERRSPLNPNVGSNAVLRVKHRIPLDSIHVSDITPLVQPNLPTYVGNGGTVTSSVVGAAVLAASVTNQTTAQHMLVTGSSHFDPHNTAVIAGNLNGQLISQSNLTATAGSSYPYMFELEYVDPSQASNMFHTPGSSVQSYRFNCPRHSRHSPQKPTRVSLSTGTVSCDVYHTTGQAELPIFGGTGEMTNSSCGCLPAGLQLHRVIVALRSAEEKADWMASLLSIQTHRLFLRYVRTLPKLEVPLRLPSPSVYRFAQPDCATNIVFETTHPNGCEVPDLLHSSEDSFDDELCVSSGSEDFLDDTTASVLTIRQDVTPSTCPSNSGKQSPTDFSNAPVTPSHMDNPDRDTLTSRVIVVPVVCTAGSHVIPRDTLHTTASSGNAATASSPQIRMATLDKLIERLTYPTYSDVRLVNTFLLMYRRVATPEALLDLLIERFRIPDPEFFPEELETDLDKGQLESPAQHMLKRFRSGFKKRVQARVIMVISRWVRSNRYYQSDFATRSELCNRLLDFLSSIQARHLLVSVRRIHQYLQARSSEAISQLEQVHSSFFDTHLSHTNNSSSIGADLTDWRHPTLTPVIARKPTTLDITSIHPYKLAEQVTLYEWELYRAIQFWEVENPSRTGMPSPNLDRSKQFSNRFRNWLVYAILAESHPEDRVVAIQRVIDLMLIMESMNNLQGCQEAKSALISAAVYRLRKCFQIIRRMRHYRETVDRLRRENTTGSGSGHKTSTPTTTSLSALGLSAAVPSPVPTDRALTSPTVSSASPRTTHNVPAHLFAFRVSKAHEKRIKALAKQHASGESAHPCVPFIAAGVMTRLIHLDVLHPDTVKTDSGTVLINCWKFRQLAEVVERYLAFQRIPYMFTVNSEIRDALELIDPFVLAGVSSEAEFESRMYELSEQYEPREVDANVEIVPPVASTDRRLTKEAIQAAALLSNAPLKERMSFQSMFGFADLLITPVLSSYNASSRIFTPLHSMAGVISKAGRKSPSKPNADIHETASSGAHASRPQHRYFPVPVDTNLSNSVRQSPINGGIHQHSMSDSLVLSTTKRPAVHDTLSTQSTHHQTTHSIAEFTISSHHLGLSLPPTPLHSTSQSVSSSHCLAPPLPPRKSGAVGRLSQSPSLTISWKLPRRLPNAALSDIPLDPAQPLPPLPPKMPTRPSICLHPDNQPCVAKWSPKHTQDPTFHFDAVTLIDTPPPLPPRRATKATVMSGIHSMHDTSKSAVPFT